MAVFEERKGAGGKTKYRVLIRLKGHPAQSATFDRKTDAKKWATQTEAAIREGRHFKTIEAKRHTFGDMIDRYIENEIPKRRTGHDKQKALVTWWKDQLGLHSGGCFPGQDCRVSGPSLVGDDVPRNAPFPGHGGALSCGPVSCLLDSRQRMGMDREQPG